MTHTFAAKLAAFYLNALKLNNVNWDPKTGFAATHKEVLGILPLLHMNITKTEFVDIVRSSETNFSTILKIMCSMKNVENNLSKDLGFKCSSQSDVAADILVQRMIETIETGYNERKQGQKLAKDMAEKMMWQYANGIIPESSIKWTKGLIKKVCKNKK